MAQFIVAHTTSGRLFRGEIRQRSRSKGISLGITGSYYAVLRFPQLASENGQSTPLVTRNWRLWQKPEITEWKTRRSSVRSEGGQPREPHLRVLFAAGGTGGHVYPAIAVADELKAMVPGAELAFAGTRKRMEWSAVPAAGYPIHAVPAVSVQRPLWSPANLLLPLRLLYSLWMAWRLVRSFRPHVVVGTGGYVSVPACLAAALCRVPVLIQEQNAFAGVANRILAPVAAVVCIAFAAAQKYFSSAKCVVTGNPVRSSLLRGTATKEEALAHFFPPPPAGGGGGGRGGVLRQAQATRGPRKGPSPRHGGSVHSTDGVSGPAEVVLVMGGSLGAGVLNRAMEEGAADRLLGRHSRRFVVWQTGRVHFDSILRTIPPHPRLRVLPFIDRMDLAYACADVAVCRAGAITCSELLVTGTPAVLVPSLNVAEDHQTKNAVAMAECGAAEVLHEKGIASDSLANCVEALFGNVWGRGSTQ